MSGETRALARAAMQIGRRFGVGGRTWTLITGSGDGVSSARTLAVSGLVTLYVVRNALNAQRLSLPQTAIWMADWLAIGAADTDLAVEAVLVNAADPTLAFSVSGTPASDLGFLLAPLKPAANPLRPAALRRLRQGAQLGVRQGF